ncbi:MAG: hypothetical protein HY222_07405 [Thaumarchaeota archaeon]|nr:hypothetical protein [Nitrososphaerota archaeon]MBI3642201.1 hypothetical protein [Nitrososphaerota archaeon]
MQQEKIMHFYTINELQSFLTNDLEDLKKKSNEYSKLIGEKLRVRTDDNSTDLAELKEKLEGPTDPKKKKPVKKKDQKTNWHNLDTISIYDGIGVKGELELYFKALDALKLRIDKVQKAKETIDGLVSRGLKKDLGCVVLMNKDLLFEMVFVKTGEPKAKFSFKAIFNVPTEQLNKIEI